ncbi:MAG: hypothetical protein PHX68_03370 [Alphaproteobacteria bacterium]|nr:hypothetical protein [Alphaproteobacteria bacterium]
MARLFFFSLCLMFAAAARADDAFLPGAEDIPVMSGLVVDEEASASFDAPAGQIVQVVLDGPDATWERVRDFYAGTLAELGWRSVSDTQYRRAADEFSIRVLAHDPLKVQFDISLMNED